VQELIDPRLRRISIRDEVPARTLSLCYARQREPTPAAVVLIDAIRAISAPPFWLPPYLIAHARVTEAAVVGVPDDSEERSSKRSSCLRRSRRSDRSRRGLPARP
jgi:hypothetical protein